MSRSTTTGLYTRVDNSFSNPVVGTTISPSDADSFFDDIESSMNAFIATSASSVEIGTGAKTFTVASDITGKAFLAGTFVHVWSRADSADYMFGTVTSYSTSTGELVLDVTATGGSGTNTDWNIMQAGARGATGATGATGPESWATPPTAWLTATAYSADAPASVVTEAGECYVCATSHTSGTFATDLAAARWIKIAEKGADGSGTFPGSSTDNAVARFDGAGGTTIQNSGVIIDDSDNVSGVGTLGCGAITSTGALSIGTSNAATVGSVEIGHASDTTLSRASAGVVAVEGTPLLKAGKTTIWIPASAMIAATTSGPASAQYESSSNDRNLKVLDFDASADEHAHFNISFPKGWDEGTITFRVKWQSTATDTDGVAWGLEGTAISDNEDLDAAWGTAVVVTDDAQSAAGEQYTTSESSAVTIAGTPAEGDVCYFRIFRDVSDANDDMTEDARLIGVEIFFTTNAANDI